ncbi:endonuclease V [Eleftheria terrae]|uniref:endonuclease V n=1 Tax=Eleftheria terrae TaxID=1597781 RepID=UPI00263B07D4|nr:endonuclease V [Eleftheria terrae]WKB53452.1 endonuclease V [Eleftheria terrae]
MMMAVDVDYREPGAVVAGVSFEHWEDAVPLHEHVASLAEVAPYEPGAFYKRELPCLLALLRQAGELPQLLLVDGYVHLGAEQRDGLGIHLWRALHGRVPVIGVAKTAFAGTPAEAALLRGDSARPLFISAAGIALAEARECVARMHGRHRLPTLLKRVDRLCREASAAPASAA